MKVVVDVNELFSLLIRGTSRSEAILFSENFELIAPEFLLDEFLRNREEILKKNHRSEADFDRLLEIFRRRITLIPKSEFEEFVPRALSLFPEHTKDVQYLALAIKFDCILWTEEKLLRNQDPVRVNNTWELFEILKGML